METFKMKWKKFWKLVWELFKNSIPGGLTYLAASSILMMIFFQNEGGSLDGETTLPLWSNTKLLWTLVCGIVSCAYQGLIMYGYGGTHYDMLVTGNFKRINDGGYRASHYKEEKEYRPWKGFGVGGMIALSPLVFGIIFGLNQEGTTLTNTNAFVGVLMFLGFLLSGWCILPIYSLNSTGIYISYYYSCLFGILPIVISGIFYIVGAYGRRGKAIKKQEAQDKASMEVQKPKKINYGGLPGTKPKKRK